MEQKTNKENKPQEIMTLTNLLNTSVKPTKVSSKDILDKKINLDEQTEGFQNSYNGISEQLQAYSSTPKLLTSIRQKLNFLPVIGDQTNLVNINKVVGKIELLVKEKKTTYDDLKNWTKETTNVVQTEIAETEVIIEEAKNNLEKVKKLPEFLEQDTQSQEVFVLQVEDRIATYQTKKEQSMSSLLMLNNMNVVISSSIKQVEEFEIFASDLGTTLAIASTAAQLKEDSEKLSQLSSSILDMKRQASSDLISTVNQNFENKIIREDKTNEVSKAIQSDAKELETIIKDFYSEDGEKRKKLKAIALEKEKATNELQKLLEVSSPLHQDQLSFQSETK